MINFMEETKGFKPQNRSFDFFVILFKFSFKRSKIKFLIWHRITKKQTLQIHKYWNWQKPKFININWSAPVAFWKILMKHWKMATIIHISPKMKIHLSKKWNISSREEEKIIIFLMNKRQSVNRRTELQKMINLQKRICIYTFQNIIYVSLAKIKFH